MTGTDTGVGKTLVASTILSAASSAGLVTVGMKPVASGCAGGHCEDVEALMAASSRSAPREQVNPYALERPVSPHIAAAEAGVTIRLDRLLGAYHALDEAAEVVVVEGIGGFRVPLGPDLNTAELARALGLPVILVVGLRLGCLNHALLTADAIRGLGLSLGGWVANVLDPAMLAVEENIATLVRHLGGPPLLHIERLARPDPAVLAGHVDLSRLGVRGSLSAGRNASARP